MTDKTQRERHPDPPSLLPDAGGTYAYEKATVKVPATLVRVDEQAEPVAVDDVPMGGTPDVPREPGSEDIPSVSLTDTAPPKAGRAKG